MRQAFSWVKKIISGGRSGLTLFSPTVVADRNPIVKLVVGGATIAGILASAIIGMAALAALLFALVAIYYLTTQVLGLKVNLDPTAFVQSVQRQAANYGAN